MSELTDAEAAYEAARTAYFAARTTFISARDALRQAYARERARANAKENDR